MSDPSLLPTFFVIGAAKSGTTSLHNYLAGHPEITMAEPKEPHLMIGPGWRDRARGYDRLFAAAVAYRGDASPGYAHLAINPDAPGNIAELVPDARLIYLVRDPVERTIAHYAQHVTRGVEEKPIEHAIRPQDPDNYYVTASLYASIVESYLERFDAQQMLVVDLVDLRERRRETLTRIFAHVGADPDYWDDSFSAEHNVRGGDNLWLPAPVRRIQAGRLGRSARRLLPPAARKRVMSGVRRVLGREVRPDADAELRARLAETLAPQAERLRRLTGQRFESWSV